MSSWSKRVHRIGGIDLLRRAANHRKGFMNSTGFPGA